MKGMEARIEELKDNGHAPTSQYDFLAGKVQNMEFDNFKTTLTHEIEKTHAHIDAVEGRLNARIDVVTEQIKSTNARIDSLDTSLNARIDSLDTSLNARIDSLDTSLNARIDSLDTSLNARIDSLDTSLNARIDSLDTSLNARIDATNTRIDDMKTIVDKTDKRISNMLVIFGIAFAGLFAVLGVILSKLG